MSNALYAGACVRMPASLVIAPTRVREAHTYRAPCHTNAAYEHWHGMLFARFLAENHLLIEPEMGVAITLDECEESGQGRRRIDKWTFGSHASRTACCHRCFGPITPYSTCSLLANTD